MMGKLRVFMTFHPFFSILRFRVDNAWVRPQQSAMHVEHSFRSLFVRLLISYRMFDLALVFVPAGLQ